MEKALIYVFTESDIEILKKIDLNRALRKPIFNALQSFVEEKAFRFSLPRVASIYY